MDMWCRYYGERINDLKDRNFKCEVIGKRWSRMKINKKHTNRGFNFIEFDDLYGAKCSIQKSSLAAKDAIWFGVDDADPQIMASKTIEGGTGWVKYNIPEDVMLTTRMHLSRSDVKKLLPILQKFIDTGEI